MSERLNNILVTCDDHSLKPRPEIYGIRPIESFMGKYVKLGFDPPPRPDNVEHWPKKEHMWVIVKHIHEFPQGKELYGVLNNDPLYCDLVCGQGVFFTADEIEAVYGEEELRG